MNPINLALRFALEVTALGVLGWWGWSKGTGIWRGLFSAGVVMFAAMVWAGFAVPGDPSRGGSGWVHVPGIIRLVLELAFFGAAASVLYSAGHRNLAVGFAAVVVAHYLWSYRRVSWLLQQ